ncbi:hypothetical protein J6J08_07065 [Pseudidiomarina sp. 1APR75-33.1]|uniref:hypothetical protein n=1 Tax=Pseudidiomarina terrestris TaxID=2820060 RepID=UPI00264BF1B1|nr:hypothetical protein [Pseudidiomarina sp. 1APR75-33.1]MDN7127138.1 hypothetical protein [Pseudidiomarina sp. 1APR75-33.1]
MHKKVVLFILLGCAVAIWLIAAWMKANSVAVVDVAVSKTEQDEWFVAYHFEEVVERVYFVRNPDSSRLQRWDPLESGYYLAVDSESGDEYVARTDGAGFNSVAFRLDPTYIALRKDYAPFSTFSDGGVSWFTGRFKVCPTSCSSALAYSYNFSMQAPLREHIRLPEQSERGELNWRESASDGQVVYVGPQALDTSRQDGFETIIDPILPRSLQQRLRQDVPPLTAYFNQRMPPLSERPMLLASFSPTTDGRFGYQGGVVGNQMLLHWYGHSMAERVTAPYFVEDTLWFIAHEFAHLYQAGQFSNEQAWIHEGAAEFMALSYLRSIRTNSIYLNHRLQGAQAKCNTSQDSFEVHYACGLLWAADIDAQIQATYPHGLFFLWYMYVQALADDPYADATQLYFELLAQLTSETFAQQMRTRVALRYEQLPQQAQVPAP